MTITYESLYATLSKKKGMEYKTLPHRASFGRQRSSNFRNALHAYAPYIYPMILVLHGAQYHGAEITLESVPERGTVITVIFPSKSDN